MKKVVIGSLVWGLVAVLGYYLIRGGTPVTPHERVLVTAAHLGEIPGYTQVYADPDTDYALYVVDNYVATCTKVGAAVKLADTTGTIISVADTEFTVDVDNISKIVPGVSGSPVTQEGVPIGFISGWNGAGALRCIFY